MSPPQGETCSSSLPLCFSRPNRVPPDFLAHLILLIHRFPPFAGPRFIYLGHLRLWLRLRAFSSWPRHLPLCLAAHSGHLYPIFFGASLFLPWQSLPPFSPPPCCPLDVRVIPGFWSATGLVHALLPASSAPAYAALFFLTLFRLPAPQGSPFLHGLSSGCTSPGIPLPLPTSFTFLFQRSGLFFCAALPY